MTTPYMCNIPKRCVISRFCLIPFSVTWKSPAATSVTLHVYASGAAPDPTVGRHWRSASPAPPAPPSPLARIVSSSMPSWYTFPKTSRARTDAENVPPAEMAAAEEASTSLAW
eukprot:1196244-Prorocentrum_minimum.AAC.5